MSPLLCVYTLEPEWGRISFMTTDRLPASIATLYAELLAELLEQALLHESIAGFQGQLPGGLVTKNVRSRCYLCWQVRTGVRLRSDPFTTRGRP